MIEPITAMATASAAFQTLKKGFAIGRDLESMAGDVSRWMGALSDLDQAEKEAKNPPIFRKLFASKSVEQEAIEVFAAKRKAQAQREELREWITVSLGIHAWDDLIKTEAGIRKQRQETLYAQREKRRKFVEVVALGALGSAGVAILAGVVMILLSFSASASSTKPSHVTCRLTGCEWIDGSRVCVYIGANNTQEINSFGPNAWVPRQYQCKYRPNKKRRPTLKETLNAIKDALN